MLLGTVFLIIQNIHVSNGNQMLENAMYINSAHKIHSSEIRTIKLNMSEMPPKGQSETGQPNTTGGKRNACVSNAFQLRTDEMK